jgi:aryl-alcohol dehydrogenase-like predicted oxidoreductase
MQQREFGKLGFVSALTLGGGGIGQVWGETNRAEAIRTVHKAVDNGINFLDVAPSYGQGEAERVIGDAFGGVLPEGVRISTKHHLGEVPPGEVALHLQTSLEESLERLQLEKVNLFFLHGMVIPDNYKGVQRGTPRSQFIQEVRPAFEKLVRTGRIDGWGISGIGVPSALVETLEENPRPNAIQCITNLLDSAGSMHTYNESVEPRKLIGLANKVGTGVMGIRAVQAGALTDELDREVPHDHPEMIDYKRASGFRRLAAELGVSAASLAHRYALSMDGVSTVVLGVKNCEELEECLQAEKSGPLTKDEITLIDQCVGSKHS